MGKLIILEDDGLLRKLNLLVYRQETQAIHTIDFKSENERTKYLKDCKSNKETVLSILDAAKNTNDKFKGDETKASIAHDIYSYAVKCINSSLQTVNNYYLRLDYLGKIKKHSNLLMQAVDELDPKNMTNVKRLAKEATQYKESMDRFLDKYQSGASKQFADRIKKEGLTFPDLVKRYQEKLGFKGRFEDLEDTKKIQVYDKIIKVSGRGQIITDVVDIVSGVVGTAVLIVTLGIAVWDIFSSERPMETASKDAAMAVSAVGGAAIGDVVAAVAATLVDEVEASTMFITMAGFVGSIAGAFIIAAVAGAAIALIFSSGGSATPPTEYHCYVTPLPDGAALARQIAHDHGLY